MDAARQPNGEVLISLSYDEAVVLSDVLHRWERMDYVGLPVEDQADERIIWDLSASLEPVVDEVFSSNWDAVLAASRAAVRDLPE